MKSFTDKLSRFVLIAQMTLTFLLVIPVGLNTYMPLYIVQSESMLPTLKTGTMVFVHNHQPRDLPKWTNQIIAYFNPVQKSVIIHRVIAVHGQRLITQGDHNPSPDIYEPSPDEILGLVFAKF